MAATVIHVITRLEFGGAQQNTLYTVANLNREEFAPVLVTGPGGYLMKEAERLDLPLHISPRMQRKIAPLRDLAAYREIRGIIRQYSSGAQVIVHTHSSKAGIIGRWAARHEGVPVIIHSIHGFGFTPIQSQPVRSAFVLAEKLTSRITDHFIAVSNANRDDGISMGLFPPDNCTVIRSGFDLSLFADAAPLGDELTAQLKIKEDSPIVLMVACLKPQKNPLEFARVAESVNRVRPDVHFLLAGDGELRGALEAAVETLGIGNVFHILGWREDVPRLMKSSNLVVLTSLWEGLPRVIPQAKASGKPVVATAVDGSAEAIRDGVDGFLCKPHDHVSVTRRILELLADPERAQSMGRAGSLNVTEFDRDVMVRDQEVLYRRLLENKSGITMGGTP